MEIQNFKVIVPDLPLQVSTEQKKIKPPKIFI